MSSGSTQFCPSCNNLMMPREERGECRQDTGLGECARCGKRFGELEHALRTVAWRERDGQQRNAKRVRPSARGAEQAADERHQRREPEQ